MNKHTYIHGSTSLRRSVIHKNTFHKKAYVFEQDHGFSVFLPYMNFYTPVIPKCPSKLGFEREYIAMDVTIMYPTFMHYFMTYKLRTWYAWSRRGWMSTTSITTSVSLRQSIAILATYPNNSHFERGSIANLLNGIQIALRIRNQ